MLGQAPLSTVAAYFYSACQERMEEKTLSLQGRYSSLARFFSRTFRFSFLIHFKVDFLFFEDFELLRLRNT